MIVKTDNGGTRWQKRNQRYIINQSLDTRKSAVSYGRSMRVITLPPFHNWDDVICFPDCSYFFP